ncbi:hypothetical protein CN507_29690 [Bacillus cereus]|uniref:Uncharacterized protein n=1 Tax=Bacillus cereus TaxID=1396 RepID=A0A1S9TQD1_BACCE|nr:MULTISPECIES: hypothetical protein [Bacillus cereus group]KZD43388.1 hypothetical protein B4083_0788 [Bacillus cereus]OOR12162.1 hypothetical protein BW897_14310 [Bacillus cereus]OOR63022.1 hypothetical protein BLX04_12010 [Bacillus mycoides]PEA23928.1 hypothetical protein CON44_28460 [Bacillus cereus]PEQ37345.1 hypothetical protein CN467_14300 [Bacillus cereus]
MDPIKMGKYITYVAVAILLIFSMLLPYSLSKKIALIIFVLILGAISLGVNKVVGRIYNKFKQK